MTRVPLTLEEVEAGRSPAGGWNKATLAAWGVPWPPPKGWKEQLMSDDADGDDIFRDPPLEPVTDEETAWARALVEADQDNPDRIVGQPALPLWRSYIHYARQSMKAAAILRARA